MNAPSDMSPEHEGEGTHLPPRTLFVLNLALYIINGVTALNLQRYGLPRECFYKDLGARRKGVGSAMHCSKLCKGLGCLTKQ